ncbi:MAG: hypothetical protein EP343_10470 [Deltaproteobacteria bacterium]|nr:MAG: hypothetical protein EP343_10470 [Deltaproteobacteria bacterium]
MTNQNKQPSDTTQEKRPGFWKSRILFLAIIGMGVVGGGSFGLFSLLGFPRESAMAFAAVLAFEAICLLWLGMLIRDGIRESIHDTRYEPQIHKHRALIGIAVAGFMFLLYFLGIPKGIWYQTAEILLASGSVLFSLFSILISGLISAEMDNRVKQGFAERWLPRLPAFLVVGFGILVMMLFNFLGGIYWWYRNYVTLDKRATVEKRTKVLRSIQLTSLFDRHRRYLGLFQKTESDWSRHYNDPQILKWKVSQVIGIAEGRVQQPAWWWKYLPDGEKLKCEPFSIEAFLRVPYYMIKQRRKVGGSTPALQAAKNFLDFGQRRQGLGLLSTVRQKLFDEMPRSYILCQNLSPEEMMAFYQSIIWAGTGANYGLHRLGLYFFGQDEPPKLTWNQAVIAVASLPNPGRLNPWYLEKCRKGKCQNARRQKVYDTWRKRIKQIKGRLRSRGIKVPKGLPIFKNGMGKLKAISREWKNHDLHLRNWVEKMAPDYLKDWKLGSQIYLHYDRKLMVGQDGKPGLLDVIKEKVESYREQLDELQLSFSLIDSRNGRVVAQYGGDGNVDMALARKPVVGSMFKVITLMVGDSWPDELPLLNKGRYGGHRRRFFYHPTASMKGHVVRNSHSMPPYVKKVEALQISANVGFVFFSLRWTWLASPIRWMEALKFGLQQLYVDKLKKKPEEAEKLVGALLESPNKLRRSLIRNFGYKNYLRNLRQQAAFEAAKAATIRELLGNQEIKKEKLTDLLALDMSDDVATLDPKVKDAFLKQKETFTKRYQTGELTLEILSWARELRMEMGLRYLIHLAETIGGYDRKLNNLKPVMTLTLGVNDTQTHQVASIGSFVTSGKNRRSNFLQKVVRGGSTLYHADEAVQKATVSTTALDGLRKAMNAVLTKGTAKWAGAYLKKQHGEAVLAKSGAKTGTVQKTRGISCVGFVGHRAGAVTLSTPTNSILKTFRIRRSLIRRRDFHKKRYQQWLIKYEASSPGTRKARRYRKYAVRHQGKAAALEQIINEARQTGKVFHKLRKAYKAAYKKAIAAKRRARRARIRDRVYRRRAQRLKRYERKYKRYKEMYRKRLRNLMQSSGELRKPKNRTERRNVRRYFHWSKKLTDTIASQKRWIRKAAAERFIRKKKLVEYKKMKALYRQKLEKYRDSSSAFHKTHERWTLSSSRACLVLFTLLSHWKTWEDRVEQPPKETDPALASPTIAAAEPSGTVLSTGASNPTNSNTTLKVLGSNSNNPTLAPSALQIKPSLLNNSTLSNSNPNGSKPSQNNNSAVGNSNNSNSSTNTNSQPEKPKPRVRPSALPSPPRIVTERQD